MRENGTPYVWGHKSKQEIYGKQKLNPTFCFIIFKKRKKHVNKKVNNIICIFIHATEIF